MSLIMIDGLPSSRNREMQLDLPETAWRDPERVPSGTLHSALRAARQLTQQTWVSDEFNASTAEDREWNLDEDRREVNELLATLPQRTDANGTAAIEFLKRWAVPNPFHHLRWPQE